MCGGESTRMGRPKAWLSFGDEFLLQRIVRIISQAVAPVIVVAAPAQVLPPLPDGVEIERDEHEKCGPLEGLAVGLSRLQNRCDAVYATSCDVPFITPVFIETLIALLGEHDAVIPRDEEFPHPLAAIYRTRLAEKACGMIAHGQRRLQSLVDNLSCRWIDPTELRSVDPALGSLRNLNSPEDYSLAVAEYRLENRS